MLTLYYSRASCAYAPHILLHDAGADFTTVEIDFATGEQTSPDFLAINPKGRVPALVTPDGILTENPAILLYIAQTHPETKLAPSEPFALARAQSFNMFLASTVHVAHSHKHRGARWADDPAAQAAMTAKVTENMAMYAGMIEAHYFTGPWVLGEDYSMCDAYLALITRWLGADGVDLADFPNLQAHDALMRTRPSMQAVMGLYS
ncbi:MAG TPA: glutathione S-transferase [Alphaproteobacteria bacterium]|nr:glutathione S-transferase [Alphaproteobacteria bacterium]